MMVRSLARLGAALLLIALLTGCGKKEPRRPQTDAAKLAAAFTQATGVELRRDGEDHAWTTLRSLDPAAAARFGAFAVYVVENDRARDALIDPKSPPGADGVRKGRNPEARLKDYGKGVLVALGEAPEGGFARLDRAIGSVVAGRPERVPATERSCVLDGIEPAAGKAGTCWLGAQHLTVADAGQPVRMPGARVTLSGARTARTLPTPYSGARHTDGRFVVVRFRLRNDSVDRTRGLMPNLIVDGRTYVASGRASGDLDSDDQRDGILPNETGQVTVPFEVPAGVAAPALERGQLELRSPLGTGGLRAERPGEPVARLRLAGAPSLTLVPRKR